MTDRMNDRDRGWAREQDDSDRSYGQNDRNRGQGNAYGRNDDYGRRGGRGRDFESSQDYGRGRMDNSWRSSGQDYGRSYDQDFERGGYGSDYSQSGGMSGGNFGSQEYGRGGTMSGPRGSSSYSDSQMSGGQEYGRGRMDDSWRGSGQDYGRGRMDDSWRGSGRGNYGQGGIPGGGISQDYGQDYGMGSEMGGMSGGRGGISGDYGQGYNRGSTGSFNRDWAAARGPHSGRGPKGYKRSDERIKEDVCECLTQHGNIDASNIEVNVKDGEITLQGTVNSRQEKRMAEDAVENLSGVKEINNMLRVQSQGATSQAGQAPASQQSTTTAQPGAIGQTGQRERTAGQ